MIGVGLLAISQSLFTMATWYAVCIPYLQISSCSRPVRYRLHCFLWNFHHVDIASVHFLYVFDSCYRSIHFSYIGIILEFSLWFLVHQKIIIINKYLQDKNLSLKHAFKIYKIISHNIWLQKHAKYFKMTRGVLNTFWIVIILRA